MIITCINCLKKFEVSSELIPDQGRTIQCGSCNHIWFFDKNYLEEEINLATTKIDPVSASISDIDTLDAGDVPSNNNDKEEFKANKKKIIKDNYRPSFGFSSFLSIILVLIITFIASLIIIDTFKTPLFNIFPDLEVWLFNFFETLKDLQLFIIDLI